MDVAIATMVFAASQGTSVLAPEYLVLAIMFLSLAIYAIFGGADFGAGVWEFTMSLQSDQRDRRLIADAIGPVWEANHVWLIFVLIILLNGFPPAFAALCQALWLPLLLAAMGIIFRGAGFVVRAYAVGADWLREIAGAIFALGSTCTPFFLGMGVGALSDGKLNLGPTGRFEGNHAHDWITPMSLYCGILAVGMCAYLASVFLTREAMVDDALLERWRGRALSTGIWIGILAVLGLVMCRLEAPELWQGIVRRGWPLVGLSIAAGVASLQMLRTGRYRFANATAATAVASILAAWGMGMFPMIVPPVLSIESAKAPAIVLWAMVICIAIGSSVLFPALWWLFRIFKHSPR